MNDKEYIGSTIKGLCVPQRLLYPKLELEELPPGSFGILEVDVGSVLDGSIPATYNTGWVENPMHTICVQGLLPPLEKDETYYFECVVAPPKDPKYGLNFNLTRMNKQVRLTSTEQRKMFLESILTEHQIELLYDNLTDPFKTIDEGDLYTLSSIKGIGRVTAEKMLEKYTLNKNDIDAFLVLREEYGLTDTAVAKLHEKYHSTDTIIAKLRENPYELMEIDGYGFKKCDALALNGGMKETSKFRVAAYVLYFLQEQANVEGHSWIYLKDLLRGVVEFIPDLSKEKFADYLKEWSGRKESPEKPWLYYDEEQKRIGLKYYRDLEENICKELFRILNAPKRDLTKYNFSIEDAIKKCEEENGWEYTDEQLRAIHGCFDNNITIITGRGGCVDKDTEFFNGEKWKPISEYVEGDKVLQYNKDGTANLVSPERYIKLPCDNLWLTQTKYGVDMCLSDEHRVIYQTTKGNLNEHTMKEVIDLHETRSSGFDGRFYTSFIYDGFGINLTDAEIKVMCAVICDGSFFKSENSKRCRFHIKKDRKKEMLRKIFAEANIDWVEHQSAAEGYIDFYIYAPIRSKIFTKEWYNCTQHQLQIICDNILFWDGSTLKNRKRFSSNVNENAEFVQFAFSACGYKAVKYHRSRVGERYFTCGKYYTRKSEEYDIQITSRNMVSIGGFHAGDPNKTKILPYKPMDGYKYCFTVPSSMWVMRRNGKILITGNSGKTATVQPIARFCRANGLRIEQTALSGRAASNLSEVTNVEGKTIHRLLEYKQGTGFGLTKDNQLHSDVIIIDEVSMNNNDLFYALLQAVPDGCKIIMLGDACQLPAIGVGSLLKDCLETAVIPCYRLTKIHRQAQRSAIITESIRVSDGKQIIGKEPISEIRGELKDLKVVTYKNADESRAKFLREYKELLDKGISVNDIVGVVPNRTRGALSCLQLNNDVQRFVNNDGSLPHITAGNSQEGYYTIRLGDRIINRKNHYDTMTVKEYRRHLPKKSQNSEPIYNGNLGFVTEVNSDYIIVDFKQQGEIVIPRKYWEDLMLGYVVTAHSFQGSQAPYVIVGLDMAAYTLLSKEHLYTSLTRAKEYCVLVGQISAIQKSVAISRVKKKQTWLKELLLNFENPEKTLDNEA